MFKEDIEDEEFENDLLEDFEAFYRPKERIHDISIDSLLKANTKLSDDNRYLKEDKIVFTTRMNKTIKAIDKHLETPICSDKQFLKGIRKILEGDRSSIIEELLREIKEIDENEDI